MRQGKLGSVALATAMLMAACAEQAPTTTPRARPQQVINGQLPGASAAPGAGFDAVDGRSAPPALPSYVPSLMPSPSPKPSASPSVDATATATPTPSPSPSASSDAGASGTGGTGGTGGGGLLGNGAVTVSKLVGGAAGFENGPESTALFNGPVAMAIDLGVTEGMRLYVADQVNHRIRQVLVTPTGNVDVTTYAGMGAVGDADASTAATATFRDLRAMACSLDGSLYVADGHRIRRIAPNGGEVTTIAGGEAGKVPAAPNDAPVDGSVARFQAPSALAATSDNNLIVADTGNHRIQSINLAQGQNYRVSNIAGTGTAGFTAADDQESLAVAMDSPNALAVDVNGVVYFADKNHRIRSISNAFRVNFVAGAAGSVGAGDAAKGTADGSAGASSPTSRFDFSAGVGLATYPANAGSLYVVEAATHRLRLVHQGQVKTLAGATTSGSAEGAGDVARFNGPLGVVYNNQRLVVLDAGNHRIRLVMP